MARICKRTGTHNLFPGVEALKMNLMNLYFSVYLQPVFNKHCFEVYEQGSSLRYILERIIS